MYNFLTLSILFMFVSAKGYAQKIIYYGSDPKNVEVNAFEQTMLSFPAPAYAYSCNPSNITDFQRVESLSDYDQMTLKLMRTDKKAANDIKTTEANTTARLMRLVPLRKNASATCIFRLADGDVVNVNFLTSPHTIVPGIDFKPLREQKKANISVIQDGKSIGVFRELIKGGNLSFLNEVTPRHGYAYARRSTDYADYVINYSANDGSQYSVWRISGKAKKSFDMPKYFAAKIGQLFYSAYKKSSGRTSIPMKLAQDESFYIYLMGSINLNKNDILGMML